MPSRGHRQYRIAKSPADRSLADFTSRNQLIDLDKETASYLQEQMSLAVLHQQTVGERMAVEQQAANLNTTIAGLRKKAAAEEAAASGNEDLNSLNIRIGRLRSSIEEDRRFRAAAAILAQKEIELQRMKRLHADGLVSDLELKKLEAEVEEHRALASDNDQINEWKQELRRLDTGVIPKNNADTPSSTILRDVMLRSFDIELQRTAIAEKVKQLEVAQDNVKQKLVALPKLQTDYMGVMNGSPSLYPAVEEQVTYPPTPLGQTQATAVAIPGFRLNRPRSGSRRGGISNWNLESLAFPGRRIRRFRKLRSC